MATKCKPWEADRLKVSEEKAAWWGETPKVYHVEACKWYA